MIAVYAVGNTVYAGTSGSGLCISTDGGQSYTSYSTAAGLASVYVQGVYASAGVVYASTPNGLSIGTWT